MQRRTKSVRVDRENATFQHFETLQRNREKRTRHREFVVEGVRQMNLAVQCGWTIKGFIYACTADLSQWAHALLEQFPDAVRYELAESLMAKLSDKREPSELLALLSMPADDLTRIAVHSKMLVLVIDRPANPGNLGTILRSCDALGVNGVVITGHAVDLYDPATVAASVGAVFTVPTVRVASPRELETWFTHIETQLGSLQLTGTSAKATQMIDEADFTRPTILFIGNEKTGLSAHYRARCHTLVAIAQTGNTTSLNVACATSILLYEVQRQRHTSSNT